MSFSGPKLIKNEMWRGQSSEHGAYKSTDGRIDAMNRSLGLKTIAVYTR